MCLPAYKNNVLILNLTLLYCFHSVCLPDSIPIFKIIAPAFATLNILFPPTLTFHLKNVILSAWKLQFAHN